jgi:hypothetical protein
MAIVRSKDMIGADAAGETILVNVSNGNFYGLGSTGGLIWTCLEQPCSRQRILDRLTGEFDVSPEAAEADLAVFLDALAAEGLTVEVEDGAVSVAGDDIRDIRNDGDLAPYSPPRLDRGTLRQAAQGFAGAPDSGWTSFSPRFS